MSAAGYVHGASQHRTVNSAGPASHMDNNAVRTIPPPWFCWNSLHPIVQDRCAAAEQRVRDMVDEVVDAFDRHLEDTSAAAKQHFRWIKRRYREKIDVNRVASRIELKVYDDRKHLVVRLQMAFHSPSLRRYYRYSSWCSFLPKKNRRSCCR